MAGLLHLKFNITDPLTAASGSVNISFQLNSIDKSLPLYSNDTPFLISSRA